ncbi:MAG TPA: IS91 family transposase [Chromatiaceae bacterium]|nr:IS91 family transposase [Chromatiaceae bacterium]
MANASLQAVIHACLGDPDDAGLNPRQRQVCHHLLDCRTEALGGFCLECDQCQDRAFVYHACRDRHCPRCQRRASQDWCERQRAAVLPVTYHHLVFTLPDTLNGWVEVHPQEVYGLLFETVWATLSAFGTDPKRLDGQLGMTAVLHTWGQTLVRHVHLHCLVPGGALGVDGTWHPAKSTYLFPVRALSRHFRGGFVSRLRRAFEAGQLPRVQDRREVDRVLKALMGKEWVVYSKPCLGRTETVVDYLGRYSHRVALSDSRLLSFDGETVELAYKDYRDGDQKVMALTGEELVRRFLLHVLPKGLMRVRHFGFLANRCRARRLSEIRVALEAPPPQAPAAKAETAPFDGYPCPKCHKGRLQVTARLAPQRSNPGGPTRSPP